jgi:multidrug efflux system membrane fusion protein
MPEETMVPIQSKNVPKILGKIVGVAIMVGAVVVAVAAIWEYDYRPETDDATLRANFVGIAPHASGHIVELHIKDNQLVKEGDLLFVVDPRPYEHAVASAQAQLVLAHKAVDAAKRALEVAEASIARAEAQRAAAETTVRRTEAEFKDADDHLKRLEPLLAKEFATTDQVETARTRQLIAADAVEEAQKNLTAAIAGVEQVKAERVRAEDEIGQEGNVNGHIAAAEAQLSEAELDLEYCRVCAPFSGKIVNFNISLGEFARVGVDVFTLVDTRTWFVVANFRETQLKHIQEGAPAEIYLQFKGGKRFQGNVVGLAWAVVPEDGTSSSGLPSVPRNLDWVRLAQRFPVRIQVRNPDDSFRLGASAVVTITGPAPAKDH